MPKEKKTDTKKPDIPRIRLKLGFYIFLFIAFMFLWTLNRNNYIPEITWKQFETEMLANNDVAKLVVVNNERVEVYIKPESFEKEKYKKELPIEWITKQPSAGPHYYFNIGSVDVFYTELEKAQLNLPEDQHVKPKEYLFEGTVLGLTYSPTSLQEVLKSAGIKVGMKKAVTLHWL